MTATELSSLSQSHEKEIFAIFDDSLSATESKFRTDYNSTPYDVGVVVVVVVVVGVPVHFKNGITFERLEIST